MFFRNLGMVSEYIPFLIPLFTNDLTYCNMLQRVPNFKYLGRILTEGNDDWPAVAGNLGKARESWGRLQRILSREGATELLHPWGGETDYREEAAERVGWEMFLPLTGGSHEVIRVHRRQDVYKQKAEHGRAVHCNVTASGPLRGGDAARRGEGDNEVMGPEGNRMGEGKREGIGDGIGFQIGDRHGGGGDAGRRKQGKWIKWGGMERSECRRMVKMQTS